MTIPPETIEAVKMEIFFRPIKTAPGNTPRLLGAIEYTPGKFGSIFEIIPDDAGDDDNSWRCAYQTEAVPHIATHWVEFRVPASVPDAPDMESLRVAANARIAKLDECKPFIDGLCAMQSVRGGHYNGPQYGIELDALRLACRPSDDGGR